MILFGVKVQVRYILWNILIWVSIKLTGKNAKPCAVCDLVSFPNSSTATHIHLTVKGLLTRANSSMFGFLKCFKLFFQLLGFGKLLSAFCQSGYFFFLILKPKCISREMLSICFLFVCLFIYSKLIKLFVIIILYSQ